VVGWDEHKNGTIRPFLHLSKIYRVELHANIGQLVMKKDFLQGAKQGC
jgi:hypothetical protein